MITICMYNISIRTLLFTACKLCYTILLSRPAHPTRKPLRRAHGEGKDVERPRLEPRAVKLGRDVQLPRRVRRERLREVEVGAVQHKPVHTRSRVQGLCVDRLDDDCRLHVSLLDRELRAARDDLVLEVDT